MPVFNNILAGAAGQAGGAAAAGPIKSVRFDKDSSGHLNRTFGTATDTKKFTISCWVKRVEFSQATYLLTAGTGTQGYLNFDAGIIRFYAVNGDLKTTAVYRDPAAWYHIVAVADTANSTTNDRLQLYVNGVRLTNANGDFATHTQPSSGATLGDWNSASTHYVNRLGTGNHQSFYMTDFYFIDGQAKEATDFGAFDDNGVWQAAAYSGSFGTNGFHLFDFANESGVGDDSSGNDNDFTVNNITNVEANNTDGIDNVSNITQVQDNGTNVTVNLANLQTMMNDSTFQDADTDNSTYGVRVSGGKKFAVKWSNLTGLTGVSVRWQRASTYDVSVETTGTGITTATTSLTSTRRQDTFSTTSTTGQIVFEDVTSGSTNGFFIRAIEFVGYGSVTYPTNVENFVLSGGADQDVLRDVPTNGDSSDDTGAGGEVSGNYCTWNPLNTSTYTFSNGNLEGTGYAGTNQMTSTIGVSSGKWYAEFTLSGSGGSTNTMIGISRGEEGSYPGQLSTSYGYIAGTGQLYNNGAAASYGATYTYGDVIGVALDLDGGTLTFYKNNSTQGQAATGLSGTYFFAARGSSGTGDKLIANWGQRAFTYTAPSGFKALCTANLPTPDVPDGSAYFDAALWTGNGTSQSITGLEFSPDLVWVKGRSAAHGHNVQNIISGTGKFLQPHTDSAEGSNTTKITAFNSDGFSLGSNAGVNNNNDTYVGWAWDAGSSTASNTDGTLTSNVRASQTAGTSIVTYTGSGSATSVGHGLGAAPDAIIVKNRDTSGYKWAVYHSGLPANESLALNLAWGYTSIADYFDAPSSTVFNISSDADVNNSGDNFIAFCFSSVEGFSKFGTYVGTGASGSPFVYLGFKPALLIIKKQSSGNWFIHDYKRPGYNQNTGPLRIAAETELTVTTYDLDLLSNGFVMRTSGGDANGSGSDYIYFAWAENPFQNNGGLAR